MSPSAPALLFDGFEGKAERGDPPDLTAGPGLEGLLLDGRRADARLRHAVQAAEEVETMEGASTFTLSVLDPLGELEGSGLFDSAVDLTFDEWEGERERTYRLVKLGSAPPLLTLTFEDRDVARLRARKGYKKASRKKVTRAQFVRSLVREVRSGRIAFYAPEVDKRQPIARATDDEKKKRKRSKGHRFPSGADVEVKGRAASPAQLKVLDDVLEEGVARGATRRVLIGAVMCVTQESAAQNLRGGDSDSVGAFQQRRSQGWPATRNVRRDARAFYALAVPMFKRQPGRSIAWLVDEVQRSRTRGTARQGADYEQWRAEAEKTVDAWLGEEGGGVRSAGSYYKRYEYKRGEPGKPEDSWACIGRLADEVRWRRFMRRGVLWYVSEDWLAKRRATLVLSRRSAGVQRIEYEADSGKRAQTATVTVLLDYFTALPGDVVALRGLASVANGRYLVSSVRRSRFSPVATVELKRPTKALPEPRAERVERQQSDADKGTAGGEGSGTLAWPTASRSVTSRFGPRRAPTAGASTNHDGIDIGVPVGTRVMAADGGKVTRSGPNGGFGTYVEIDHGGGLVTFYGHLSQSLVRVGQKVDKGDLIAKSGNTGTSSGPHLHFGVHFRGAPTDPLKRLP